ncbi:hypothetical protein OIDMADRAFT_28886 [Oidiodendron maius Zn]|uniref:Uncharacterized protein n=1 Tax=Oidiodendron maius (strain Zn) TaxID=913774 RepID=A0A0C3CQ85_OIDMZ|nr:hypothetical protein OIDMADRAFT_28886 [Oidiodendron maius Zn]
MTRQSGLDEVRMEASRGDSCTCLPFPISSQSGRSTGAPHKSKERRRSGGGEAGGEAGIKDWKKQIIRNAIKSLPWAIWKCVRTPLRPPGNPHSLGLCDAAKWLDRSHSPTIDDRPEAERPRLSARGRMKGQIEYVVLYQVCPLRETARQM